MTAFLAGNGTLLLLVAMLAFMGWAIGREIGRQADAREDAELADAEQWIAELRAAFDGADTTTEAAA